MNLQEKKNGKVLTIFLQKVAICWLGKMLVRMLEGTKTFGKYLLPTTSFESGGTMTISDCPQIQ